MTEFKSKTDTWLICLLLLAVVFSCYATVASLQEGEAAVALMTFSVGIVLPLWLLLTTRYSIRDSVLKIRCGPFSWNVPLESITSIEETNSLWSSPALSLDRLRIHYGENRSIMISPADKQAFMKALEEAGKG